MINVNFKKKISKETEFASEIVEILEEKLEEMKIGLPENLLDKKDNLTKFREDLRNELIYEVSDFVNLNKKVLTKKVA